MHTDPIADLLTRIRNAANANQLEVTAPYSKVKEAVLKVMKDKSFIESFKSGEQDGKKVIVVTLKEDRKDLHLRRISKPGQRIYVKNTELKPVRRGLGINIISTSQGVMSNVEAKKANLGGELICEIY